MAKSANQKLKLLVMMKYLMENTDEEHGVTINQIIDELAAHDISAERKSIYDDIRSLNDFGLDIQAVRGKNTTYRVMSRDFELAELKLLADSVQASRFLTKKKTEQLIRKLGTLASVYEAKELNHQVVVRNKVKAMNESVLIQVDAISKAITADRPITFRYYEYNVRKDRVLKNGRERYKVSPFAMTWDDENYYLIAYDNDAGFIKHFRVDKMEDIKPIEEEHRAGKEEFRKHDMTAYTAGVFGMFSGRPEKVKIRFEKKLVGTVIDRFGKDVMIIPDGEEHFTVMLDVSVSPQFYAWVFGFGKGAEILFPQSVRDGMKDTLDSVLEAYKRS